MEILVYILACLGIVSTIALVIVARYLLGILQAFCYWKR